MKKRITVGFVTVVAFIAVFVSQVSAASACVWCFYDPELPNELK